MSAERVSMPLDDAAAVERLRRGDMAALGPLIERYQDRVYNTCWRLCGSAHDAADLTQDVFVRAMESIGSFAGRAGFYTWLFRIAVNLSLSHRRLAERRAAVSLDAPRAGDQVNEGGGLIELLEEDEAELPDNSAAAAESHERLGRALERLDDEHRAVLVLRDVESFDYREIGEILGIPVGTVKSRLHRARVMLARSLGAEWE